MSGSNRYVTAGGFVNHNSGKTWAGAIESFRQPAGSLGMVIAPTYPMLRDSTLRTFLDLAKRTQILSAWHAGTMTATLVDRKEILFRTADEPDRLRGPNLGWFWLDEAALMSAETWPVMIGRLREQPARGWATSTPRGFNWLHDEFSRESEDHDLIRSSTRANVYLPAEFVPSLERSYLAGRQAQEIDGEFIDLTGAGLFAPERIAIIDAAPAGLRTVRRWDMAATSGGGDWTAGVKLAGPDPSGRYYILDVVRGQWDVAARNARILQTAGLDGREVRIVGPQDPGAAGKEAAAAFVRMLSGYSVRVEIESGDKATRAEPFAGQVNGGFVYAVRATWNRPLFDELARFPSKGAADDQVDAAAGAFNALRKGGTEALIR